MKKPRCQEKTDSYIFLYPEAAEYADKQNRIFWTWEEIDVEKDLHDLKTNFTESEYHGVVTTLKLFTLYEVIAGSEYWGGRFKRIFPRPEFQRMASCFSHFELNSHAPFYNRLNEVLGLNTNEFYTDYVNDPILKERMDFIDQCISDKDDLFSLGTFSMVEGAVLYSSFAFLKHFQAEGKNKLMNVTAGINFSVRDESVTPETEVLTPSGWQRIDSINKETKIAQFDAKTKEITFSKPDRIVTHKEEFLYKFSSFNHGRISQVVTPNHRMPFRGDWQDTISFKEAKDIKYHTKNFLPVAGYASSDINYLSPLEKFLIAAQADGHQSDRYTGELCGTVPITFSLSKNRKISRLLDIINSCGFSYKEGPITPQQGKRKAQRNFKVDVPISSLNSNIKNFNWVNLSKISSKWCESFIEEISHWDGHVPAKDKNSGKYIYYSSVKEDCVDKVQAIASLCGKHATKTIQKDNRKDTFSDVYRLYIHNKDEKRGGSISKEKITYGGNVYCVTVPTGAFLIRHNDCVSVTGNCIHAEGGAWAFNLLKSELQLNDDQQKELSDRLYQAADQIREHEHRIVEMIFQKGKMEGITETQMKNFVDSRIDLCLQNLGLQKQYKPSYNPIAKWFYDNINGGQFHDFFAKVGNEYTRDWDEKGFTW